MSLRRSESCHLPEQREDEAKGGTSSPIWIYLSQSHQTKRVTSFNKNLAYFSFLLVSIHSLKLVYHITVHLIVGLTKRFNFNYGFMLTIYSEQLEDEIIGTQTYFECSNIRQKFHRHTLGFLDSIRGWAILSSVSNMDIPVVLLSLSFQSSHRQLGWKLGDKFRYSVLDKLHP